MISHRHIAISFYNKFHVLTFFVKSPSLKDTILLSGTIIYHNSWQYCYDNLEDEK